MKPHRLPLFSVTAGRRHPSPASPRATTKSAVVSLPALLTVGLWTCGTLALPAAPLLSPADKVFAYDLDTNGSFPANENPPKAIDGISTTKYLNNSKLNAGIIVTPAAASVAQSFKLTTANDAVQRDPASYLLFGSNSPITTADNGNGFSDHWTLIGKGTLSLPATRLAVSGPINLTNSASYTSYWMVFTSTKDTTTNSLMQIADIQLYTGLDGTGSPIFASDNAAKATNWNSSVANGEWVERVIDGSAITKYLNFGKTNSGFWVVPAAGKTIATSMVITTANDAEGRDPASYQLHGQGLDGQWVLISSGTLALPGARFTAAPPITFSNTTPCLAYRVTFPLVKNTGENSMQVAEVQLHGTILPANDTDNDQMDDGWEAQYGLTVGVNDGAGDLDTDGSSNLQEYQRVTLPNNPDTDGDGLYDGVETLTGVWVNASDTGTDPLKPDSDADGYSDKYEVDHGTDPNVAASIPVITWDIAPGTPGTGDGAVTGGAGFWDQTAGNWTLDNGATNQAWDNNGQRTVAVFGGLEGGAVTLASPISADGVIVNTTGYTFSGEPLTLSGPQPAVTVASGTCEISSVITGTAGLLKLGTGILTLTGDSNTYTGTTTLSGTGKLLLAKTPGSIAIPGNIFLASSAGNGNNSGVVLAGDEQIADTSILTWADIGQAQTYFRLNGHTETIGGLVSVGVGGFVNIENRGVGDTADYPTGNLIINTTGTNSYSYNGTIRNVDGGTLGGLITLTKSGTGTQILSGNLSYSGATTVTDGLLEIDTTLGNSPVTVTGTGTLAGTGTLGLAVTVQSGGTLAPGIAGVGTLSAPNGVTLGSGGTLGGPGTLNGNVTVATGGIVASTGAVSGTVTVQAGGLLAGSATIGGAVTVQTGGTLAGTPTISGAVSLQADSTLTPGGTGIGTVTATNTLSLAGNAIFELNKAGATLTNDSLGGFSAITYGGTLTITATGDALELGDTFQLFVPGTGASLSGSFSAITLPELPAGLSWDTANLLSTGAISVVNYTGAPLFSPAPGGYVGPVSVTLSSDAGSTIFYTMDGSTPTGSSPSGSSPVSGLEVAVGNTVNIQAYATKPGLLASPLVSGIYRTVATATWAVDDNGMWSDPANWLNQVSPNQAGAPVDFTLPQGAETTVTLDGNRTVGSLTFGNTNGYNWRIAPQGTESLILAGPATPAITVLDNTTTISAVLAGSQGLTKAGPGTLVLSGTNTYGGTTTINAGIVSVSALAANGSNSGLGSGSALTLDGGTLRYTGGSVGYGNFNRTVTLETAGGTLDAAFGGFWFTSGVISGSGDLTKTGTGQLIIQAANVYDGVTYLNQGEIQIRTLNALGSTVGHTVVADGARLAAGGGLTGIVTENLELNGTGGGFGALQANDGGTTVNFAGNLTLASDSGVGSVGGIAFTISGPISGPGGFIKLNNNTVTLSGDTSNTYAGVTTLGDNGKLVLAKTGGAIAIPGDINISSTAWNGNAKGIVLAADEQIADTAVITWTSGGYGGTLRLNGHTETIGGLNSTATGLDPEIENRGYLDTAAYGTGTLIINTTGTNVYSYNGGIRDMDAGTGGGAIALVKSGTGTQVLRGGMSFTGTTTINGGTLEIDVVSSSSATTVASGASLTGNGALNGTLTVDSGATLAPGVNSGPATAAFTAGNTTLAGTLACDIDGAATDRLTVNGSLNLTGATLAFTALTAPTEASYVIASYTADLTGTFANVTGLPAGYAVQYDAAAKQIKLAKSGYDAWAAAQGLVAGVNDGKTQDPDADGVSNWLEFALGGNPLSTADRGTSAAGIRTVDGTPALTLTIAARAGAVFTSGPGNSQEAIVDGLRYRIAGTTDLAAWTDTITEIAPLTDGLPAAPAGYVYHTFRTAGPVAGTPADFIRLEASEQP
jgi:autotransporter-associated beta strand protein